MGRWSWLNNYCYSVGIVSDSISEEEECFIITLSLGGDAPSGVSLNPTRATVCINDDDSMSSDCFIDQCKN